MKYPNGGSLRVIEMELLNTLALDAHGNPSEFRSARFQSLYFPLPTSPFIKKPNIYDGLTQGLASVYVNLS